MIMLSKQIRFNAWTCCIWISMDYEWASFDILSKSSRWWNLLRRHDYTSIANSSRSKVLLVCRHSVCAVSIKTCRENPSASLRSTRREPISTDVVDFIIFIRLGRLYSLLWLHNYYHIIHIFSYNDSADSRIHTQSVGPVHDNGNYKKYARAHRRRFLFPFFSVSFSIVSRKFSLWWCIRKRFFLFALQRAEGKRKGKLFYSSIEIRVCRLQKRLLGNYWYCTTIRNKENSWHSLLRSCFERF